MKSPIKVSLLNSAGQPVEMPKGYQSPLRSGGKPKDQFGVVVETAEGPLRIFPSFDRLEVLDELAKVTAKAILDGKIHGWGMPQVIKVN